MIHKKFKKFMKFADTPEFCERKPCGNWVSCGPNGCLHDKTYPNSIPTIPCKYCGFWTGYGLKDWQIENFTTMLEIMTGLEMNGKIDRDDFEEAQKKKCCKDCNSLREEIEKLRETIEDIQSSECPQCYRVKPWGSSECLYCGWDVRR